MDARNDFLRVVDADGTEHHVNLDTVAEVTFDRAGVASLYTAAPLPSQQGARYTVTGEEATRLRAARGLGERAGSRAPARVPAVPHPASPTVGECRAMRRGPVRVRGDRGPCLAHCRRMPGDATASLAGVTPQTRPGRIVVAAPLPQPVAPVERECSDGPLGA